MITFPFTSLRLQVLQSPSPTFQTTSSETLPTPHPTCPATPALTQSATPPTLQETIVPAITTQTPTQSTESLRLYPKDVCRNPQALCAIGGTAKLWRQNEKINWTLSPNPLNVSIVFNTSNKWQTPLIHRIDYLQRTLSKKMVGRFRSDPKTNNRMHYVDVLKGDLENEEVCGIFEMVSRPRNKVNLGFRCDYSVAFLRDRQRLCSGVVVNDVIVIGVVVVIVTLTFCCLLFW